MPGSTRPDVTAVVGNYQGEHVLGACLASLDGQTIPPAETIVVDAASTDDSPRIAAEHGARFEPRENRGLGHLYNEGARTAGSELVLLLNNDVALEPDCVEHLAAALLDDPSLLAAAPCQRDWSGENVLRARITLRRGAFLREPLPGFHLELRGGADDVAPALMADGAAVLVRREKLLELGGFDETFFLEFEDLDLCWRGWLAGRPTVYVPQAVVRHRVGAVTDAAARGPRSVSAHHNLLRFALKCLPPREAAVVVAGELARLPRHPRAVGRALVQVARELPEIVRLRRSLTPSRDVLERLLAQAQHLG